MNEKAIINMKDEIHYIYFEFEKTNNMLHIFSEFVEDEGLISASTDNEDKQWMSICFTNRLPMPVYPPTTRNSLPPMRRRWIITPDISSQSRTSGFLWRSIPTREYPPPTPRNATASTG